MNKEQLNKSPDNENLSLKEVILIFDEYLKFFKKSKYIILKTCLWCALIVLGIFVVWTYFNEKSAEPLGKTHTAILKFEIMEMSTTKAGNLVSRALDFQKIKSLTTGDSYIENALLHSVFIDGKNELIANNFIKLYGLDKVWDSEKISKEFEEYGLSNFSFELGKQLNSFTGKEKRAMSIVKNLILGFDFEKSKFSEYKKGREQKMRIANQVETSNGKYLPEPEVLPSIGNNESILKIYDNSIEVNSKSDVLSNALADAIFEEIEIQFAQKIDQENSEAAAKLEEIIDSTSKELAILRNQLDFDLQNLEIERKSLVKDLLNSQLQMSPESLVSKKLLSNYTKSHNNYKSQELFFDELIKSNENLLFNIQNKRTSFNIINKTFVPIAREPRSFISSLQPQNIFTAILIGFLFGALLSQFKLFYSFLLNKLK